MRIIDGLTADVVGRFGTARVPWTTPQGVGALDTRRERIVQDGSACVIPANGWRAGISSLRHASRVTEAHRLWWRAGLEGVLPWS